jgi:flavin reductase (DIM6/NTAB) family NADH-FMN oxidoreductase RutF
MSPNEARPRDAIEREPVARLPITGEEFVAIMSAFPTGVAIVSSVEPDGTPRGLTTNAVTSVSLEPPILLVCLDLTSRTLPAVRSSGRFAVNFMRADCEAVCRRFATKADDKFDHLTWARGVGGVPLLSGHAVAIAECAVQDELEVGDHAVVTGLVEGGSPPESTSEPILYFRRSFQAPAS